MKLKATDYRTIGLIWACGGEGYVTDLGKLIGSTGAQLYPSLDRLVEAGIVRHITTRASRELYVLLEQKPAE